MILPQTYGAALFVLILGLVCLGSWASAYKMAGKYRYELFYVDFALGALVLAMIYALTVGNLGFDGFSFMDDLSHSGKRQWFLGFVAGVVFNLGNMLLLSSVSVSGMAVAFPAAFGMAMIASTTIKMLSGPAGNSTLLLTGCALLFLAIVMDALAFNTLGVLRHEVLARAGKAKSTRRPVTFKGVLLAAIGGLLLGAYLPLLDSAREGDVGVGPYTLTVLFAMGVFASTLVYSIFFINLPVQGDPVEPVEFLKAGLGSHAKGILAGAVWCTGTLALWVAGATADLMKDSQVLVFWLSQGAPLVAAVLGLVVWKEFRDGDMRVKAMSVLMLLLFASGLALLSMAPVHGVKAG